MPPHEIRPDNRFLALAWGGRNLFLSGMAGTGKSTLLREFIRGCREPLTVERTWADGSWKPEPPVAGPKVDVVAPTGIAALNVSGATIHRFCGMLLGPTHEQSDDEYFDWLAGQPYRSIRQGWQRVERCECLVIDEISMLSGRHFQFVEYLFRRLRGDDRPWGGAQVIVVGDFLQLAPVRTSESRPYDWAFLNQAWWSSRFEPIVLKTVRRQDEADFIEALAGVRAGRVTGRAAQILHACVKPFPPETMPRLYTHNSMVDRRNAEALGGLEGEEKLFVAETAGPENQVAFLEKNLMCPRELRLKEGARVMFTRNDANSQYVNGSTGAVTRFTAGGLIEVRLDAGWDVLVEPYRWQSGEDDNPGSFTQFPLRLAYAMTIHKSQGITLDGAYIDIRAAREPGQAYVALSRVRSLAGLWLKDWFRGLFVSEKALQFHASLENPYDADRFASSHGLVGHEGSPGPVRVGDEGAPAAVQGPADRSLPLPGLA